jgi:hypothetical protein
MYALHTLSKRADIVILLLVADEVTPSRLTFVVSALEGTAEETSEGASDWAGLARRLGLLVGGGLAELLLTVAGSLGALVLVEKRLGASVESVLVDKVVSSVGAIVGKNERLPSSISVMSVILLTRSTNVELSLKRASIMGSRVGGMV